MGLSFSNRQTVQVRKNRTAGLSQSNARKYNSQCKLANQRKTLRQHSKKVLLADGCLSANTLAPCCCECCFVLLLFCFGFSLPL